MEVSKLKNGGLSKQKFEYKWVIAAMCFLMVFTGLGFCSSAKSIYIVAITEALGFSRSAFLINDSFRYITTAIVSVFFGTMVHSFGTKKMVVAGLICLVISSFLYSVARKLFVFYLGGVFLGLGVAWTTTTMMGVVINKWFKKNKGTVLGAVLASNGLGAAVAIHIVTPIIYQQGNAFGYQTAYKITAAIIMVVLIIVLIFYRENPPKEDIQESLDTGKESEKKKEEWRGFEFYEVTEKPYFYCLIVCVFLHMLMGVGNIVTPHLNDVGLDASFVASALSIQVIALAIFKFVIGFIYDRFGIKVSTNICLVCSVFCKLLLFLITSSPLGKALTVVYSILTALSAPIETVLLPILALDLFGERSYHKTLGILAAVTTTGQAIGTPALSLSYDIWQSYNVSFLISLISSVLILIAMNWAMLASKKEKSRILN